MSVAADTRILGLRITPMTRRRWRQFRANSRGYWSAIIFGIIFFVTLPAEFIANDRPLLVTYDGSWYFPILREYPETTFGGDFETEADYRTLLLSIRSTRKDR